MYIYIYIYIYAPPESVQLSRGLNNFSPGPLLGFTPVRDPKLGS